MSAFIRHRIMSRLFGYDDDVEFIPYNDGETNLAYNPYEPTPWETEEDVDEESLTRYISKILVSQAIDLADGKNLDEDKIPRMYRYQAQESCFAPNFLTNNSMPRRKHGNKSKTRHKSRRSREPEELAAMAREAPPGSDVFLNEGISMVTLPLPLLKQYMLTEVDARVRAVHYFYEYRHELVCRDRAMCIAELLEAKNKNDEALKELRKAMATVDLLRNINNAKMSDTRKESQRRRRQEKKKRKNDTGPSVSRTESKSSRGHDDVTGSCGDEAASVIGIETRKGGGDMPNKKPCDVKPEVDQEGGKPMVREKRRLEDIVGTAATESV